MDQNERQGISSIRMAKWLWCVFDRTITTRNRKTLYLIARGPPSQENFPRRISRIFAALSNRLRRTLRVGLNVPLVFRPFRAPEFPIRPLLPRALSWAIISRPFGPEQSSSFPSRNGGTNRSRTAGFIPAHRFATTSHRTAATNPPTRRQAKIEWQTCSWGGVFCRQPDLVIRPRHAGVGEG